MHNTGPMNWYLARSSLQLCPVLTLVFLTFHSIFRVTSYCMEGLFSFHNALAKNNCNSYYLTICFVWVLFQGGRSIENSSNEHRAVRKGPKGKLADVVTLPSIDDANFDGDKQRDDVNRIDNQNRISIGYRRCCFNWYDLRIIGPIGTK